MTMMSASEGGNTVTTLTPAKLTKKNLKPMYRNILPKIDMDHFVNFNKNVQNIAKLFHCGTD